jgi:hypothetical protein
MNPDQTPELLKLYASWKIISKRLLPFPHTGALPRSQCGRSLLVLLLLSLIKFDSILSLLSTEFARIQLLSVLTFLVVVDLHQPLFLHGLVLPFISPFGNPVSLLFVVDQLAVLLLRRNSLLFGEQLPAQQVSTCACNNSKL